MRFIVVLVLSVILFSCSESYNTKEKDHEDFIIMASLDSKVVHINSSCSGLSRVSSEIVYLSPDSLVNLKSIPRKCHLCSSNSIDFDSIYNQWLSKIRVENRDSTKRVLQKKKNKRVIMRSPLDEDISKHKYQRKKEDVYRNPLDAPV